MLKSHVNATLSVGADAFLVITTFGLCDPNDPRLKFDPHNIGRSHADEHV